MRKLAIRKEIDGRLEAATIDAAVTVERVLIQLQATYAKAFETGKCSAAVRCLEQQGRYLKMFTVRIEQVHQPLEDISVEDVVSLLKEIAESWQVDLVGLLSNDEKSNSVNLGI